jgi:hypothetical protein
MRSTGLGNGAKLNTASDEFDLRKLAGATPPE